MPKIGVYGPKTRKFQSRLTRETFGLTMKCGNVHMYLGSSESDTPDIDDIQSTVFMEVPDRAYREDTVGINLYFEAMNDSNMDFSRFGVINPLGDEQRMRAHVDDMQCALGRWLVVGDIIEIPFFEKDGKKAYWEITDVDDKPSYEKFYVTISAKVLGDSRETREIPIDRTDFNISEGFMDQQNQDFMDAVPYEDVLSPGEAEPTPEDAKPVDGRRKQQGDFLDDPNNTF